MRFVTTDVDDDRVEDRQVDLGNVVNSQLGCSTPSAASERSNVSIVTRNVTNFLPLTTIASA
jgi:hypothetical protein